MTSFGLFVLLDEIHVEGLVHVSSLGHDYFQHDATGHRLVGENTGVAYQLADRVRVEVIAANMEESKIDFELVSSPESGNKPRGRKRVKRRNPLVALTKWRGQGVEASAKSYRRSGKHKKPPSNDGGFSLPSSPDGDQSLALVFT